MTRQPDWDVDRLRGEEAEEMYRRTRTGILIGEAEVKRDDQALNTGRAYVEYECLTADGWKPSGIATTRAATWVIVFWPVVLAMPRWLVLNIARELWRDDKNRRECRNGTHPTRGVVVGLHRFLPLAVEHVQRPLFKDAA